MDGEAFLALLAAQVQLRGQPTAGAAERVVGRLDADTAGWFGLHVAPWGTHPDPPPDPVDQLPPTP
ncbi:hypothetical protein [Micromonospora sp. NBC_00858]|uniref:hypothetical protein n=1 Tax=Micromonospora sp. NBC_00858 TaxID=2975979 RepID=UPI00386EE8CF|nr:hypothetical protein OG990_07205 [Micromonospora sp. NBC_00858]